MKKLQLAYLYCCLVFISYSKSANSRYFQSNLEMMDDFSDEMSNLMHKDPVMYKIQNKIRRAVLDLESQNQPVGKLHSKKLSTDNMDLKYSVVSPREPKIIINANKMHPFELHGEYKINPKLLNIFTTKFVFSDPLTIKIRQNAINLTSIAKINEFEPSGGYKIFAENNYSQQTETAKETEFDYNKLKSNLSDNTSERHENNYENPDKKNFLGERINASEVKNVTENTNLGGEKEETFNIGNDDSADFDLESDDDSVEEIIPFDVTFDEQFSDNSLIDAEFENDYNLNIPFEGSGDEENFKAGSVSSQSENSVDKDGRILGLFFRGNGTSVVCTTPKGEPGRCLRIRQCLLSDALSNFNDFLQYLCLIRGARVGVCCPDNPVIEIQHPDNENSIEIAENDIKQPPEGCGFNMKTRIVGGTTSIPHEWTWMVALLRRNRFFCGGALINNWYVLTAAHCVMGVNVRDLKVRLGEYNFNERNEHQEDIAVAEIKRHAQFISLTFQHDIALLKLKKKVQYSKFIGSICLPSNPHEDYSNVSGTVVGWGTVSFGGAASPVLRQVIIPVWTNKDCDETYALENINDNFMCAGSPENGEDACQGDSGGPLMALNKAGRWEIIGIVSWGRRCGDPTYPGVYTRVTRYLEWIEKNAK